MIEGKTVLAIIPARGGSKGILRKNIKEVGGKPLIAWTIKEAKQSKYIDRLILSSEDEEIINIANAWGCETPFVRPGNLSLDETPGIEPVLHAIREISGFDYVVLLQPTSPLRIVDDIDGCIEVCFRQEANCCVSVTKPDNSPYWMYTLSETGNLQPLIKNENIARRQELPQVFALNGAIYIAKCEWLLIEQTFITVETKAYIMPKARSLDIDDELDLELFKLHIKKKDDEKGVL